MGWPLKLYSVTVKCAASTSSTRLVATATPGKDYQTLTILAKNSNAGTLYVSGPTNATKSGFPLTKGQSIDFGPTAVGGMHWHAMEPSSFRVFSTAGTADYVVFHYLSR